MKKMVYTGLRTDKGDRGCFTTDGSLKLGKIYEIEPYTIPESHNGNGGSTYWSIGHYVRVFKNGKMLLDTVRPCSFTERLPTKCSHKEVIYASETSSRLRCDRCLKFVTVKVIVK